MGLRKINALPKGSVKESSEEILREVYGYYGIDTYTKGSRRYFELVGFFIGQTYWSTSINEDKGEAIKTLKDMAESWMPIENL